MRIVRFIPVLTLILLGGCSQSKSEPENSKTSGQQTTASIPAPQTTTKTLSDLPESLKTDAYHYYGLANTVPLKMHVLRPGSSPLEGDQTIAFKSLESDHATFLTSRGGALADLGSEEVSLEPDGVYVTSSSVGDIGGKSLELPSVLKPGTEWSRKSEITKSNGQKVSYDAKFKVVRIEKVKTPAGEFDGLLISSDGPAEIDGQKFRMTVKSWYVKDVGPVKISTQLKAAKGPEQTMTIEATK